MHLEITGQINVFCFRHVMPESSMSNFMKLREKMENYFELTNVLLTDVSITFKPM